MSQSSWIESDFQIPLIRLCPFDQDLLYINDSHLPFFSLSKTPNFKFEKKIPYMAQECTQLHPFNMEAFRVIPIIVCHLWRRSLCSNHDPGNPERGSSTKHGASMWSAMLEHKAWSLSVKHGAWAWAPGKAGYFLILFSTSTPSKWAINCVYSPHFSFTFSEEWKSTKRCK